MTGARVVYRVAVDGSWMDDDPVTNAEFRRFADAAGHVLAEIRSLRRQVEALSKGTSATG
jgi:formylglycine-generating enzyme required for sulfatase activity